jgi:hypothetical protein
MNQQQQEPKAGDVVVLKRYNRRGLLHHTSGTEHFYFLPFPPGPNSHPLYILRTQIKAVEGHIKPMWGTTLNTNISPEERNELSEIWTDGEIPESMLGIRQYGETSS